jgi:hypothetical protein
MQKKNRKPVGLEALEDRWVPASIRFDGSNLTVYNLFITAGASATKVIQGVGSTFSVTDGGADNGSYAVTGNITIQGNNAKDTLTVNVNATTGLLGNLTESVGNGSSSVAIDSSAGVLGTIFGNVNVSTGNGLNTVSIGAGVGMNTRGNTNISARGTGDNVANLGGGATNASTFSGNVTVSDFPTTNLGGAKADVFAGNVTVNDSPPNSAASVVTLSKTSTVFSNLDVLGSIGGPTTVTVDGNVFGNLTADLGNGQNSVSLGVAGTPIQVGNVTYIAGNGVNVFNVNGAANNVIATGNVYLNWGNGANSYGTTTGLTVEGSFFQNDGNGGLTVTGADAFEGQVYGGLSVNAGNGPNQFDLSGTGGALVGGTWTYNGGNGGNSLTIDNASANSITLNLRMGTLPLNNVTITAATTGGTLTGLIDWAVPSAANPAAPPATINGFVDNGYVWTNAITLINIPS